MAFYYVKGGGTATGDAGRAATKRTGSFAAMGASAYYDGIKDVFDTATTAPNHGDFIVRSNSGLKAHTANVVIINQAPTTTATTAQQPLTVMTVDDSNADTYVKATTLIEAANDGFDYDLLGASADNWRIAVVGLYIQAGDDFALRGDSHIELTDTTIRVFGSTDVAIRQYSNATANLKDCTLIADGASNAYFMRSIAKFTMVGGSLETNQATKSGVLFDPRIINMQGVDMSGFTATYLVEGANIEYFDINITKCKLPTLTNWIDTNNFGNNSRLRVTNSGQTSAGAEYQFYDQLGDSFVEDDTTKYRDDSPAFTESGTNVSLKCETSAGTAQEMPFFFDFPTRYVEFSNASTDTVRIYLIADDASLTNNDIWFDLYANDATTKHSVNAFSTGNKSSFDSGTSLVSNSDDWTGTLTGYTKYQIDIDTSSNPCSDCSPRIVCSVGKPSLTIFFAYVPDVVA